jgi:hypothetical protein
LDHGKGVGKVAVAHGRAGFDGGFEQLEHLGGAFDVVLGAIEPDPAFAGGGFDAALFLEELEVARFVIEELLGESGVFEVEGLGGHARGADQRSKAWRRRAASSVRAWGTTEV